MACTITACAASTTRADPSTATNSAADATTNTTIATSTTTTSTSTTSTTTTTTSTTTTSTTSTTLPPPPPGPVALDFGADEVLLGHSTEGRPLIARRVGETGGRRVLVIGVIHGDEDDGVPILDDLAAGAPEEGVEMWLVESMNPDGQAAQVRHNARRVDLNRNFPYNWGPIGEPGDSQYAGEGPASEPETQTMVQLISTLQPDIVIWYHQDLFTISPSSGRGGRVRARYAELTGLPLERITGGTYTGVAATWARSELGPNGGVAFIVELGPTLDATEAEVHADAVRTIAREG